MKYQRAIAILLAVAMLSGLMVFSAEPQGTRASPGTLIDHFNTDQRVTQVGPGSSGNVAAGLQVLGGERDVWVTMTSGGAGGTLIADANLSVLDEFSHSEGSGVIGISTVIYDGLDGDAQNLDPVGLGGLDLTNGGLDNALALSITSADWPTNFSVKLNTDATNCSSFSMVLPGAISASVRPRAFVIPFSSFTQDVSCGAGPGLFTDVGALSFSVGGIADPTDITIHFLAATSVDFGDAPDTYGTTTDFDYAVTPPLAAAHVVEGGLFLGASIDGEINGQPGPGATGDDLAGIDDADGVVVVGLWQPGVVNGSRIDVTVNGGDGCFVAWVDWNNNGSFNNTNYIPITNPLGERLFGQTSLTTGTTSLTFTTPAGAFPLPATYRMARFRLFPRDINPLTSASTCTSAKFPGSGHEVTGEVEDYLLGFHGPTAVELTALDAETAKDNRPLAALSISLLALAGAGVLAVLRGRRGRKA